MLVLATAGSPKEAARIADALLRGRAAACVNVVPKIESRYWWQGKLERGSESLLLIKTFRSKLGPLSRLLKKNHSYEVPEIIALPIRWGDRAYLDWMAGSV